ncbi:MAG: hypothetical protein R2684_10870 [Pyrinomonadaceae bacterium]
MPPGALENMGLGRLPHLVTLGTEKIKSEPSELKEAIDSLVFEFKQESIEGASVLPPLGSFQSPPDGPTPLTTARLVEISRNFNGLIGNSGGPNGGATFDRIRRIYAAMNLLNETFNDHRRFAKQAVASTLLNVRM